MGRKKQTTPPTLPGEVWRGEVEIDGAARLYAVAIVDAETPRWTYVDFDPCVPTVAGWTGAEWLNADEYEQQFVYAVCLRAMRDAAKEKG